MKTIDRFAYTIESARQFLLANDVNPKHVFGSEAAGPLVYDEAKGILHWTRMVRDEKKQQFAVAHAWENGDWALHLVTECMATPVKPGHEPEKYLVPGPWEFDTEPAMAEAPGSITVLADIPVTAELGPSVWAKSIAERFAGATITPSDAKFLIDSIRCRTR